MNKTEEEAIKYAETQASVFMFPSDKEAEIAKINNKFGFMAGAEWQKKKAIEAFKEECPCWSRFQQDRKCDECAYLKDFCNQLD